MNERGTASRPTPSFGGTLDRAARLRLAGRRLVEDRQEPLMSVHGQAPRALTRALGRDLG